MALFIRKDIERIQKLVMSFVDQPGIVVSVFEILDQSDLDRFTKAIVTISLKCGTTLRLLASITETEFLKNKNTPASILRGNTPATKLMSMYCRHVGMDYLNGTLSELVQSFITTANDIELDPAKAGEMTEEEAERRRQNLKDWISKFVNRITSPEAVELLPRAIKALCFNVLRLARKYGVENVVSLVGGFIMLRFVNPALITPEAYKLCPASMHTAVSRRYLTLVTKALQNVSNQREFNESYMLEMNSFIHEQVPLLENYLRAICIDTDVDDPDDSFRDLFAVSEVQSFDADDVDLAHYKLISSIFFDEHEAIAKLAMELPDEDRATPKYREFMEEMVEFLDGPAKGSGRSKCGIPVEMHKVDLLKKDHDLDVTYKKFRGYSKSLQVPLIVDGNIVLEESTAILIYLCEKYFLSSSWYPFSDMKTRLAIHEILNWMEREVHAPVLQLWKFVRNLSVSTSSGPDSNGRLFASMKKLNDLISARKGEEKYSFGPNKSLVDLAITFIHHFCQLQYGYASTAFPALHAIATEYQKATVSHWKTVNSEFLGFAQYVIGVSKKDSLPKVEHTIFFQETPHTIYEMILDPENDIFLYLASKTISTKTNAKVKQGLKKLNSTEKEDVEAAEKEKVPYVIALDVGGKFNVHRREGTNLVLVPGNMIVQESTRKEWPPGHHSTEIYELYTARDSRCKLVFTQMNCPIKNLHHSEDVWDKFWRKISGVRTRNVRHEVFFKGKPVADVYQTFCDVKQFAKLTKTKVREEDDGMMFMHNKSVVAKYTTRIKNEQIVQLWRCTDWMDDHYSTCTMVFETVGEFGTRVEMTLTDVPIERQRATEKIWKENVWKKLGGVLCEEIHHRVVFRSSPDQTYKLWTSQELLDEKLQGKKCVAPSTVGEPCSFVGSTLKGTVMKTETGRALAFSLTHKDWPTGHLSFVTLEFEENPLGCKLLLTQRGVPTSKSRSMDQLWTTEFWDRLGAVKVGDMNASVILQKSPEMVFQTITSSDEMTALVKQQCSISREVDGEVRMFDKMLKGKVVQVVENHLFAFTQRAFDWPYSHTSEVIIELLEHNAGKGTLLLYSQRNIPVLGISDAQDRWETLSKELKKHCARR